MKKNVFARIIAIALVAMSLMAVAIPAMAGTTDVYVDWVPVSLDHSGDIVPCIRSGKSKTSSVVIQLSGVNTVNVKADTGNIEWIRCEYGSYSGYIHCSYINFSNATFRKVFFANYNLQQGFRGEPVRNLQLFLKKFGYYTITVDNLFGSGTKQAVKSFQSAKGLTSDGIAGSQTSNKILDQFEMSLLPE